MGEIEIEVMKKPTRLPYLSLYLNRLMICTWEINTATGIKENKRSNQKHNFTLKSLNDKRWQAC